MPTQTVRNQKLWTTVFIIYLFLKRFADTNSQKPETEQQ